MSEFDALALARSVSPIANTAPHRFTGRVQLERSIADPLKAPRLCSESVDADPASPRLHLVRNPRARRYILRLRPDGSVRVTIPRGGSAAAAEEFVARQGAWLNRQRQRLKDNPPIPLDWRIGSELLLRGEPVRIQACHDDAAFNIRFGTEQLRVDDCDSNLRAAIERHLRRLASQELPPRLLEYASVHRLQVRRVSVRNQHTRWGSCSHRGSISLNWRLIQAPPFVRDYILLHELMHLREMNHSHRFWRHVESVCPYYPVAERWLKAHARWLR